MWPSSARRSLNARPGQADARQLLGQPIANQMVFAGEAVLFEPHGALHAAQQSGVVAAGNALAALKAL